MNAVVKKPEYQSAPPESLRESVFARGYIEPLELFRIGAWKSAMGLGWMTLNSHRQIEEQTRVAVSALSRWRGVDVLRPGSDSIDWVAWRSTAAEAIGSKAAGTGLLGLAGVEYPMATAIAATLVPTAFPVMDRWVVLAVFGRKVVATEVRRAVAYTAMTRCLVDAAIHYPECTTVHQVDQAVMNTQSDAGWRGRSDLLPFPPIDIPSED